MGLFDFFKMNKGIEDEKFNSSQLQTELCAFALWQLEKNDFDSELCVAELKKQGLNASQANFILSKTKDFLKMKENKNQQSAGLEDAIFLDEQYQMDILEFARTTYFENNHSYEITAQKLLDRGLNASQANQIVGKLRISISEMVGDFQSKLDSGEIVDIKITPNPEHVKGKVTSDQVDRYIGYGAYQMQLKYFDNALELFDKALELDDKATLAYANKGSLYSQKGDNEKALYFYNKAIEIEPGHLGVLENKMNLLFDTMTEANEDEFINTVKAILKYDAKNPNALIYIIQYNLKNNNTEDALISVKTLFAGYHGEDITIQLLVSVLHKLPEERALSELSTYKNTIDVHAQYQLEYCKGLYLKDIEKYDEAIKVYNDLNRIQEFSWNYYQMAIMKSLQNKTQEAIDLLKKTFELEPGLKNDAKQFDQLQNLWTNPDFIQLTK